MDHDKRLVTAAEKQVRATEPELEQALARLKEAEAKYRGIFQSAQEGIFQTTPDGRYLSANPALARMLGYDCPVELMASVTDIGRQLCVRPESREQFKRRLEQEGQVRDFENEIYRKDGTIIWTSVNARVVRDARGAVLYYEGTSQDITERRKAEALLATLGHAIESTSEMICITDLDDRFTFVNRAFADAYGYTPEEIQGKTPDILFSPKNPPELLQEILVRTRAGGWCGEVLDRRKDGTEFPVSLATSLVRDKTGRVVGLMGVARDITARKQAEAALQEAQAKMQAHAEELEILVEGRTAKLREMVAELHHVSYALIHDMRAPLRAMAGFAELLASEEECDPAEARSHARRIAVAAARLDHLITDALNYTKVLHQQLPIEPVDLSRLLRGLIESYPNLHPDTAEICLEEPLPVVLGSESLLTQCFSNLLGNAVKFVAPGATPRVRVYADFPTAENPLAGSSPVLHSAFDEGGSRTTHPPLQNCTSPSFQAANPRFVRIWVEDNGVGIPDSVRHRLFGMFQRFNNEYEGTGIGLAIVRKVTEQMGGTVGVESEVGKGSRFWVQLRGCDN
jgi:PAS domain S-box-containing protein